MSVNIKQEISITAPATLREIKEFYNAAINLGVDQDKPLRLKVTAAYSDIRESWPESATITAAK